MKQSVVARELARGGVSSRGSLARQSVSARPLAILPILLGSIATGSRSDTRLAALYPNFVSGSANDE